MSLYTKDDIVALKTFYLKIFSKESEEFQENVVFWQMMKQCFGNLNMVI